MDELKKRRQLHQLGKRAVVYYMDTGQCVFCDADDALKIPHSYCSVGEVAKATEEIIQRRRRHVKVDMTKAHALSVFKSTVIPQMAGRGLQAKAQAWGDYTQALLDDGYISRKQYERWANPF